MSRMPKYSINPMMLLTIVLGAVAMLAVFSPAEAATGARAPGNATTTIYRCDMRDGSVAFADKLCPGARSVGPWRAPTIAKGLHRSAASPSPSAAATVRSARHDHPYQVCRRNGGEFFVAARLCKLPEGITVETVLD